ncbi:MAG: glycerol-3-phosphate dehydrogenase [Hyphomicrobiales bacterium]|nr:MAG: glycerol-3-phosphate dehydrogenase [Hyphomicrobiales bacterium]
MTNTTPREGSTEAPTRHPIDWQSESFYDEAAIEAELTRVFDICHGCRRCFNLCESFPRLFDMVDESSTGELDGLDPKRDYPKIIEACTLCDMCFMTKCPYVPPHEFDLDLPHLILRYRAAEFRKKGAPFTVKQLSETDRNGKLAGSVAGLANWGSKRGNSLTRPLLESTLGIDRDVELPKFHSKTFSKQAASGAPTVNTDAPAHGRKVALYATCFVDYNEPGTGVAAQAVLARNGVESEVVYPACCGMPHLEHGDIEKVANQAKIVSTELVKWIDKGYDIVTLTASCGLMLKFEWPLILPDDENIKKLSGAVRDISEYMVDIAKNEGLAPGLQPVEGGITVHMACHARAQNMGSKAAEMLRNIPDTKVEVVERCSGHGGTFGVLKETHDCAVKVAKPAVGQIKRKKSKTLCSECPLACKHLIQVMQDGGDEVPESGHPIGILARAYGIPY